MVRVGTASRQSASGPGARNRTTGLVSMLTTRAETFLSSGCRFIVARPLRCPTRCEHLFLSVAQRCFRARPFQELKGASAIESFGAATDWKSKDSWVFAAFLKILPDNPGIVTIPQIFYSVRFRYPFPRGVGRICSSCWTRSIRPSRSQEQRLGRKRKDGPKCYG